MSDYNDVPLFPNGEIPSPYRDDPPGPPEPPAPDPSDRETPQALYDALDARFGFCWDVAATAANCKVRLPMEDPDGEVLERTCYFGPGHPRGDWQNALALDWREELWRIFCAPQPASYVPWLQHVFRPVVWCNPPWGRGEIEKWCAQAEKMAIGFEHPAVTTVMLLPADPSTRWFHEYVLPRRHYWQKGRNAYAGDAARLTAKGTLSKDKKGTVLVLFEPELPSLFAVHGR